MWRHRYRCTVHIDNSQPFGFIVFWGVQFLIKWWSDFWCRTAPRRIRFGWNQPVGSYSIRIQGALSHLPFKHIREHKLQTKQPQTNWSAKFHKHQNCSNCSTPHRPFKSCPWAPHSTYPCLISFGRWAWIQRLRFHRPKIVDQMSWGIRGDLTDLTNRYGDFIENLL